MTKGKKQDGENAKRGVRGKSGPASATKNEKAQGAAKGGGASRLPKLGKHEASNADTSGDGLH